MTEEVKRVEPTIGDTAAASDVTITPKKLTAVEIEAQQKEITGVSQTLPATNPAKPAPAKLDSVLPEQAALDTNFGTGSLSQKSANLMNQFWGITPNLAALAPYVHGDDVQARLTGGLKFRFLSGESADWEIKRTANDDTYEQISFDKGLFGLAKFTQTTADGIAAIAQSKGWEAMDVHGKTLEDKEKLWLAAQSAKIDVTNFQPLPTSKVWEQLKERNPQRFEELTNVKDELIGVTKEVSSAPSKFAPVDGEKTTPAAADVKAPEAAAKPTFNQWLDTRAAEAKSPTEAEGFKVMSRAVQSGAVKLDELDQKSIQTQYKPKVRDGVMEADGKGYNRVVDIFKAKGVDAPQKVPEQEVMAAAPKVSAPAAPKV